jgi:hypothetical protein
LIGQTKLLNWRVKLKKNQINKWIKKNTNFQRTQWW